MNDLIKVKTALVSVYHKNGLKELCQALHQRGIELYATSGTGKFLLDEAGVPSVKIEALTQYPELMDGRVKTLHPRIFGGILARRENPKDMQEAKSHEIPLFDLVIGNLYPFAEHLNESAEKQNSFIDIGGPS